MPRLGPSHAGLETDSEHVEDDARVRQWRTRRQKRAQHCAGEPGGLATVESREYQCTDGMSEHFAIHEPCAVDAQLFEHTASVAVDVPAAADLRLPPRRQPPKTVPPLRRPEVRARLSLA